MIKQVIAAIVIATIGGSFGFGWSQLVYVSKIEQHVQQVENDVKLNVQSVGYLRETDARFSAQLLEERLRTDQRVAGLSGVLEKMISLNQELVSLVKVQIELINRKK